MTPEEKQPYLDQSSADSIRYKREMEDYLQTDAGKAFLAERNGEEPPEGQGRQSVKKLRGSWSVGSPYKPGSVRIVDGPLPYTYARLETWLSMQKSHWNE